MTNTQTIRTARAAAGAMLFLLMAACSDAPSSPPPVAATRPDSRVADEPGPVELLPIRSRIVADGMDASKLEYATPASDGVAQVSGWRMEGALPAANAVVALRVRGRVANVPARLRPTRLTLRLPDGRVAVVTRETAPDGTPTEMRVQVGADEFRWARKWTTTRGTVTLRESVVESRRSGRLMTSTMIALGPPQFSMQSAARLERANTAPLRRYAARFGSIAGKVLLPRAALAQSEDYGKACNAAATSLSNAWTMWRLSMVSWSVALASGSLTAIVGATTALFAASANVDNAEAAYLDCYVAAMKAGVPDQYVAQPPVADEY
ncbi:MAG: hypothetical protein HY944_04085 [Gemmatimonadetes bacterium]|nr:hypothetical protein [Gemmatimonadota bacterium]